jgi:hypothetical protein
MTATYYALERDTTVYRANIDSNIHKKDYRKL